VKLSTADREVLKMMAERPESGVTIWYIGNQVASCHVADPKGFSGVTDTNTLDDWHVRVCHVRRLIVGGFVRRQRSFDSTPLGRLQSHYEVYELTDAGREAIGIAASSPAPPAWQTGGRDA
jgi:hypothetical protein